MSERLSPLEAGARAMVRERGWAWNANGSESHLAVARACLTAACMALTEEKIDDLARFIGRDELYGHPYNPGKERTALLAALLGEPTP